MKRNKDHDKEKKQPTFESSPSAAQQIMSTALTLQQLNKEKEKTQELEKKEAAAEAAKVRCRVCFKEIAPTPRCFGHGGGGGASSASAEPAGSAENESLIKSDHLIEALEVGIGEFSSMDSGEVLDLNNDNTLDIIEDLLAQELLLIENNRESMTLTIILRCKPNALTEEQRNELKKFMDAIIKEFNEFKEKNGLSNECIKLHHDEQNNILSLSITMPTLVLYDALMQKLATQFKYTLNQHDEVNSKQCFQTPFSITPQLSASTQETLKRNDSEEDEEQSVFNPSPFNTKPWSE